MIVIYIFHFEISFVILLTIMNIMRVTLIFMHVFLFEEFLCMF